MKRAQTASAQNIRIKNDLLKTKQTTSKPNLALENSQTSRPATGMKKQVYEQIPIGMEFFNKYPSVKTGPKVIPYDKEKLYEENLYLKSQLNEMKSNSATLQQKLICEYRDNQRMEKIISNSDFTNQIPLRNAYSAKNVQNGQAVGYKRQIKELKEIIQLKDDELQAAKRTIKFTKSQEQDIEIQLKDQELDRLKTMLQQSMSLNKMDLNDQEMNSFAQFNSLQQVQKDNIEMAAIIKMNENRINQLEQQYIALEQKNERHVKREETQSRIINKQKQLIKNLENQLPHIETPVMQEEFYIEKLKKELKDQMEKNEKLQQELDQSKQNSQILENMLTLQERSVTQSKLQQDQTIIELQQKNSNLMDQIKKLRGQQTNNFQQEHNDESSDSIKNINPETGRKETIRKIKVKFESVKKYGMLMKFELIQRKIQFEDIEKWLFNENMIQKKTASISQIQIILENEPFNLSDQSQSELVARYLIEDNDASHIMFNKNLEQTLIVIKSVFNKLIGKYKLLSNDENEQLLKSCSTIISKYKGNFNDDLECRGFQNRELLQKLNDLKKPGFSFVSQILQTNQNIDSGLNNEQLEFVLEKIYEQSRDINLVDIKQFFILFDAKKYNNEQKERTQSISSQI